MKHHFDIEVAELLGINKAIILDNISYWTLKKSANEQFEDDGLVYIFNSVRAWEILFPYLSQRQIRSALKSLEEDGYLKTRNDLNKHGFDKTKHYALTNKGLSLFGHSICTKCTNDVYTKCTNGDVQNVQHNTNSKQQIINPDKKHNVPTDKTAVTSDDSNQLELTGETISPPPKRIPAPTTVVFDSYVEGMKQRYGKNIQPARNAKINAMLKKMIERVGFDEAVLIARTYPLHQNSWYVQKVHAIDFMLQDCESLLVQVQSGQMVTRTQAYQSDKKGQFQNQIAMNAVEYDDTEEF